MNLGTQVTPKDVRKDSSGPKNNFIDSPVETLLRYAWLEQEDGIWYFLASPFADPMDSARKWTDEQQALNELEKEGWKIVRPYPEQLSKDSGNNIGGYGLKRTVH